MSEALRDRIRVMSEGGGLSWEAERALGLSFGLSPHEIEGEALGLGLRLERYSRNYRSIDAEGQLRLHRASVLVVGCGGLGGYVAEELARLGVGRLILVDPDSLDPSNLNRQIFATIADLGRPKVEAAAERLSSINPSTRIETRVLRLGASNAAPLLQGVDVAADALDSIPSRLELEEASSRAGVPLVHAAIAGFYVQATTSLPGSEILHRLYGEAKAERGIETELGNPAFTPAFAASIQTAEILRLLLGRPPALAGALFHFDLERMTATTLPLA